MSTTKPTRIHWKCPQCGKRYRIPLEAELPSLCPECARSLFADDGGEPAASSETSAAGKHSEPQSSAEPSRSASSSSRSRGALPSDVLQFAADRDRRLLFEHLENISRTMTFLRRTVWVLILALLVNVAIWGCSLYLAAQQMRGLAGLLGDPNLLLPADVRNGNLRGGNLPGQNRMDLNPLRELGRNLQEMHEILEDLEK